MNDCYNANPVSMRAALEHLTDRANGRRRGSRCSARWPSSATARPAYHEEIGALVRELGIEHVIAVGGLARAYGGEWVADAEGAAERLKAALRPGDVVLVKGSRSVGLEVVAENLVQLMARVLVAALVAMIISILSGPTFIAFLRRNEFGQHIREEGPQTHLAKQGTPTMGGLLIVLAAAIAFLPLSDYTLPALTVFGTAVACGVIGFLDDFIKLRHKRSLGLRGRWKMLMLLGITAAVGFAAHHQHLSHHVYVPVADFSIPLGPVWYGLLFLIIAGAVNGVNLTDGVDGLAAGTSIIALATLTAMAVTIFIRSGHPPESRTGSTSRSSARR